MQMNHPEVALSGPPRAMDTTPSLCSRPVTLVRSSGIAGKPSRRRSGLIPAWMISMLDEMQEIPAEDG